jgi:hypothetical protein
VLSFVFLVFVLVLIFCDPGISCLRPRSNERESDSGRAAFMYFLRGLVLSFVFLVFVLVLIIHDPVVSLRELCVELCLLVFLAASVVCGLKRLCALSQVV